MPGVAAIVNMEHIKRHYYESHGTINSAGVMPARQAPDFAAPHDRATFGAGERRLAETSAALQG